jgi:hypothetical protein
VDHALGLAFGGGGLRRFKGAGLLGGDSGC